MSVRWVGLAVCVSVAAVAVVPLTVIVGLAVDHAAAYGGVCGPYAPDIAAHPCSFNTYLVNFFGGFALFGLITVASGTAVATSAGVAALWTIGGAVVVIRRALRPRPAT